MLGHKPLSLSSAIQAVTECCSFPRISEEGGSLVELDPARKPGAQLWLGGRSGGTPGVLRGVTTSGTSCDRPLAHGRARAAGAWGGALGVRTQRTVRRWAAV